VFTPSFRSEFPPSSSRVLLLAGGFGITRPNVTVRSFQGLSRRRVLKPRTGAVRSTRREKEREREREREREKRSGKKAGVGGSERNHDRYEQSK